MGGRKSGLFPMKPGFGPTGTKQTGEKASHSDVVRMIQVELYSRCEVNPGVA